MSAPKVGERFHPDGGLIQEWNGAAWTVVCPTDDVPLSDRDEHGWLRCHVCLVRSVDLPRGVR